MGANPMNDKYLSVSVLVATVVLSAAIFLHSRTGWFQFHAVDTGDRNVYTYRLATSTGAIIVIRPGVIPEGRP